MLQTIKSLNNLVFHPVLELIPEHMDEAIGYLRNSSQAERYVRWKDTMDRFGMGTLEPTPRIREEYVDIAALNQNEVNALVRWKLQDFQITLNEAPNRLENIGLLSGGLHITSGEDLVIASQCCTSLQDYLEWTDLKEVTKWKRIWIGHPWIYYQFRGKDILFSQYIDDFSSEEWRRYDANQLHDNCASQEYIDFEAINDSVIRFRVARSTFEQAIEQLKQKIHLFKQKLIIGIQILGFKQAKRIADLLVDGDGASSSYSSEDEVYLKLGESIKI